MTKVTAGVMAGAVLGAAHGVVSAWGEPQTMDVLTSVLGRASQGIINGIMAAYVAREGRSLWATTAFSGLIGLALGGLAGIPDRDWGWTLPLGTAVGLGCGLAASRGKG